MRHASLFSGIGGFDLAAKWMGWENVFQCEIDPFCKKILQCHFPSTKLYGDIRTIDGKEWGGEIDILSGGFPCQPFSNAGERRGKEDDRFLWPEMLRVIREIAPHWIVAENVPGLFTIENGMVLEQMYADLEASGYETAPALQIPACAVNAWHRRDRLWIIAHAKENNHHGNSGKFQKADEQTRKKRQIQRDAKSHSPDNRTTYTNDWKERGERRIFQEIPRLRGLSRGEDGGIYASIEGRSDLSTPVLCRSYDGIPDGMDRVAAYGNAIVPQVAYQIFKSIPQ